MKFRLLLLSLVIIFAVVPAFAQDDTHTLTYDGFSFTYDSTVAANVNIVPFVGDDPANAMPGFSDAPYVQFLLYSTFPAPESLFEVGGVRVYRLSDVAEYEFVADQVTELNTLLLSRPDLTTYMATTPNANNFVLPFLPVLPSVQVIRARANYVESDSISGISYITVYRQDAFPFLANEFLYTFQGISAEYYVSAVFRVNADLFPAEIPADFSYDDFITNIQTYFADSIAALNAATPADFTPSLDSLDAVIASFTFTPEASS